jgi:hypothetical protein
MYEKNAKCNVPSLMVNENTYFLYIFYATLGRNGKRNLLCFFCQKVCKLIVGLTKTKSQLFCCRCRTAVN